MLGYHVCATKSQDRTDVYSLAELLAERVACSLALHPGEAEGLGGKVLTKGRAPSMLAAVQL